MAGLKIKNEKDLDKVLNGFIKVPVYFSYNIDNTRVFIDEESMKEEFENKLKEIVEAIGNY